MDDVRELTQIADLCLRIGEVLMSSGAGAADVTVTMQAIAHAYGQRHPEIDVTFTTLSMSLTPDEADQPVVLIRQVKRRSLDYEVLTNVDELVSTLLSEPVDLPDARRRMNQIVSAPHTLPRWFVTVAWGLMCAAVGTYLGGGVPVVITAFVTAMLIERSQIWLAAHRLPPFYIQVVGGAIATATAVALRLVDVNSDASLVVTANIVMLLAGIGLMGALQDGLSGFYITAGARLLEALLATAGIIAGVGVGLTLSDLMGIELGNLVPGLAGWVGMPVVVIGGAISAVAFAAACRAPLRSWLPITLISAVAAFLYKLADLNGVGRPWAAAFAAFFIGLVAYGAAGKVRVPPLVIAVSSIVPFLPGLSIYRGMSLLGAGNSGGVTGMLALMTAVSVAVALAAGVILGEYVAQPVKREARRLEDRLAGPRMVGGATRTKTRTRRRRAKRDRPDAART